MPLEETRNCDIRVLGHLAGQGLQHAGADSTFDKLNIVMVREQNLHIYMYLGRWVVTSTSYNIPVDIS